MQKPESMTVVAKSFSAAKSREVVAHAGALHIPSLDGMRAISFLVVFAAHAGLERVPGGFGVTVFFFLSGYLITTLMRIEAERTGRIDLGAFYLRRALRILPPFYIVLVAATALSACGLMGDNRLQLLGVASQTFHVSNYWMAAGRRGIASGTGVYWSLAVEEHFYLVFPFAFLALIRLRLTGRPMAVALWTLCAAVLGWRFVLAGVLHAPAERTYLCSDTRIDSIAFGCALALWQNPALARARPAPERDRCHGNDPAAERWAGALCLLAVALLVVSFVARGTLFRETLRYTLQGLALTPIFFAAIRWPRSWAFRALQSAPLRFLGTLSYTLYLVHGVVLALLARYVPLGALSRALLALGLSVAIAWVMHVLVEQPCTRLRRRLSRIAGEQARDVATRPRSALEIA